MLQWFVRDWYYHAERPVTDIIEGVRHGMSRMPTSQVATIVILASCVVVVLSPSGQCLNITGQVSNSTTNPLNLYHHFATNLKGHDELSSGNVTIWQSLSVVSDFVTIEKGDTTWCGI